MPVIRYYYGFYVVIYFINNIKVYKVIFRITVTKYIRYRKMLAQFLYPFFMQKKNPLHSILLGYHSYPPPHTHTHSRNSCAGVDVLKHSFTLCSDCL